MADETDDYADANATYWRRFGLVAVTLDALMRHADKYGTDGALDIAELILPESQMQRLRIKLDKIERERKSAHGFSIGKRRRRPAKETAAAVVALSVDGLVPTAIADELGVSDAYVGRILKAA